MTGFSKFELGHSRKGSLFQVRVAGAIAEATNFEDLLQMEILPLLNELDRVEISVGEVLAINSVGVKGWIEFLNELRASELEVVFASVSPIFVEMSAIVSNMLGEAPARVGQVQLPYVSTDCKKPNCVRSVTESFGAAELKARVKAGVFLPPEYSCKVCGLQMEFDGIEAEYAQFLNGVEALR